ncbi:hypothetical protein DSL72_000267 [Monilinia vaccinii-corymbosi]|uniref:2EXR domain-containing protein n=1 Tax=Monilinia vaccinii-corymbosi TaxID=61207 RepID=A0A8A3P9F5_9HELO|nr:hypothetical protein DSL72_000267 [Monilinia vaccinii-corymbosi]
MTSENTISNGLTQLLLGKILITSSMTRNTMMFTIDSPDDQWYTRGTAISVPNTVIQLAIENSSHLEQSSLALETPAEHQPLVTRNTLVYTKPTVNLAPVIGTKMHLSFVKMAIPACKVLLAPLTKCNTELIFLSGLGGRYLHWVFNYVAASEPAFEEPGEHIPEEDAEEEMTEEGSVSFLEHNLKCHEYNSASEAQGELELMLKEAMDDNMFATTVFTKFPDLAPEIQDMIWDFTTEEKRIIEVHLWKSCAKWMIIYASTDAKNPSILSVCKAARERGLLKYKALTVNNSWRRDKKMYDDNQEKLGLPLNFIGPEASATNFRCYINYDRDTIFINTEHSRANEDVFPSGTQTWREAFGYQFLKDLYFSSAGDQIKNIAIDYRVAEKWLDTGRRNWQYCQVFAAMPLLTKLEIVWADHRGLEDLIEKECCTRKYMVVEGAPKPLANEDRYGAKFPCEGLHRRVKNFKEIGSSAGDQRDNCAFEQFASGKTSVTWKENIMSAVRDNRPRNPVGSDPFHFVGGKSRYRDLDDLKLSQVCAEREKKQANLHEASCNH